MDQNPMVMDMFDIFIGEINKAEKAQMDKARRGK